MARRREVRDLAWLVHTAKRDSVAIVVVCLGRGRLMVAGRQSCLPRQMIQSSSTCEVAGGDASLE